MARIPLTGMLILKILLLFVFISLTTGCISHHYDPTGYILIAPETLPAVTIKNSVTLINNQPSDEEIFIYNLGAHQWYANLHLWTDEAIKALAQAIESRGGKIVENSDKVIKVSVAEAKADTNMWTGSSTFYVTIEYETGNHIRKKITGSQYAHPFFSTWPLDRATERAVRDLLSDKEIVNYLNE